jgi:hypothetical protein
MIADTSSEPALRPSLATGFTVTASNEERLGGSLSSLTEA